MKYHFEPELVLPAYVEVEKERRCIKGAGERGYGPGGQRGIKQFCLGKIFKNLKNVIKFKKGVLSSKYINTKENIPKKNLLPSLDF